MPLTKGVSNKTRQKNIEAEIPKKIAEGKLPKKQAIKQAVAIGYSVQKVAKKKAAAAKRRKTLRAKKGG